MAIGRVIGMSCRPYRFTIGIFGIIIHLKFFQNWQNVQFLPMVWVVPLTTMMPCVCCH